MITITILILIVAKALPGLNTHLSSIHVTRITSIVFLFAGALSLNILNLDSIGSGIGIYSGFFQVTPISQLIEIFLFIIGGGILIAWPQMEHSFFYFPSFLPLASKKEASSLAVNGISGVESYSCVERKKTQIIFTISHNHRPSLVKSSIKKSSLIHSSFTHPIGRLKSSFYSQGDDRLNSFQGFLLSSKYLKYLFLSLVIILLIIYVVNENLFINNWVVFLISF